MALQYGCIKWKTYKIKGDIFCTTQQNSGGAAEYTIIIHDNIKRINQRGFKWFKTFRNYQFWKQTTSLAIKKYVLSSHQIKSSGHRVAVLMHTVTTMSLIGPVRPKYEVPEKHLQYFEVSWRHLEFHCRYTTLEEQIW